MKSYRKVIAGMLAVLVSASTAVDIVNTVAAARITDINFFITICSSVAEIYLRFFVRTRYGTYS